MESGRQKVTRKDVAREAGVSETIVSYVLNKNRYVKEEKRQRVLEVVEKLQYHPNNIARALHGKGSLQILFIAEELSSGYFSELVSQMSRDAYRRGYMISLCESQEEDEFVSQILSRQFDGLFVSASGVTDRAFWGGWSCSRCTGGQGFFFVPSGFPPSADGAGLIQRLLRPSWAPRPRRSSRSRDGYQCCSRSGGRTGGRSGPCCQWPGSAAGRAR